MTNDGNPPPLARIGALGFCDIVSGRAHRACTLSEAFKHAVRSAYVFTSFTNPSETDLYVYVSDDATNFKLLKGPAYTPVTGILRDPSVMRHIE